VGGKTQAPVLQALSESLRLDYAQFLELEVFTRFGTMVDERTRKVIEHGRRIRAVLRQPQFAPLTLGEQVALLTAVSEGVLDDVPLDPWMRSGPAWAPGSLRIVWRRWQSRSGSQRTAALCGGGVG